MQKYVSQLLELLKVAEENLQATSDIKFSEELEFFRDLLELERAMAEDGQTMESIFGVPQYYFPPENCLTDNQVHQLKKRILNLWRKYNYEADFIENQFTERQEYTKLVDSWKIEVPVFHGSNGTWHLELYDQEDD